MPEITSGSSTDGPESFGLRLWRGFVDYLHVVLTAGGTGAAAISGGVVSIWKPEDRWGWIHTPPGWWLIGGVTVFVAGTVLTVMRQSRMSEVEANEKRLAQKNRELEDQLSRSQETHYRVVSNHLAQLATILKLTGSERISIYRHEGSLFRLIGRYSENQAFDKRGRAYYADNEGVIGRAWGSGDGKAFLSGLPEPAKDLDAYVKTQVATGIRDEAARSFAMKSRCLFAHAVTDTDAPRKKRIAVIVIESINPTGLKKDALDKKIRREQKKIQRLLESLEPYEPSLGVAHGKGL